MNSQFRRYSYLLADKHLRELPNEELVKASPSHYGQEVNDNHRLFMWNSLVDYYQSLPANELADKFDRHIRKEEPILKVWSSEELDAEFHSLINSIVETLWNSKEHLTENKQEVDSLVQIDRPLVRVVDRGNGEDN